MKDEEIVDESVLKQREHSRKSYWKNHERSLELARARSAKKRALNREEYNRRQREYNAKHKDRINELRRNRRKNDPDHAERIRERDRNRPPEQRKNIRLKAEYGITIDVFKQMLAEQDGKCAICGSDSGDSLGRSLHVDHCHSTGLVRGLLCTECNTGIGKLKDSVDLLVKAVEYLRRN